MKLFPAKCHERATLRKLWRQTGNSSLLPGQQFTVDCCCKWWLESQRGFQILLLSFVLLYNKSLNDWSRGEQWILFPENLNVSLDFVSGNIEILGKQNSLRLGKHWDSRETKFTVPLGTSHKVFNTFQLISHGGKLFRTHSFRSKIVLREERNIMLRDQSERSKWSREQAQNLI